MSVCAAPTACSRAPSPTSSLVTFARVGAGLQAHDDLRLQIGPRGEQPLRLDPGDPPVVLQRPHDPRDLEADLAALGHLGGEHGPGVQPERVRHPDADLDLVGRADAMPRGQRRRLEARVIAVVGDEPHRLAEPERVGRVDAVALADGVDARQLRGRAELVVIERDRELVALADRPRVRPQLLQQRGQREHQSDDAGADRDRGDRGDPAPAGGGGEARAEREQPAAAARGAVRRTRRRRGGSPPAGGARRATRATSRRRRRPRRPRRARPAAGRSGRGRARARSARRGGRRRAWRRSGRRGRSPARRPVRRPRLPRPPAGRRSGRGRSRGRAGRPARSGAAGPRRGRPRRASCPRPPARPARTRRAARSRSPRPATAGSRRPCG